MNQLLKPTQIPGAIVQENPLELQRWRATMAQWMKAIDDAKNLAEMSQSIKADSLETEERIAPGEDLILPPDIPAAELKLAANLALSLKLQFQVQHTPYGILKVQLIDTTTLPIVLPSGESISQQFIVSELLSAQRVDLENPTQGEQQVENLLRIAAELTRDTPDLSPLFIRAYFNCLEPQISFAPKRIGFLES